MPSAAVPSSALPIAVPTSASPVTVPSSMPSAAVPSSASPNAVPTSASPVTVPSSMPSAAVPSSASPIPVPNSTSPVTEPSGMPPTCTSLLSGSPSQFSTVVIEWLFQENFSQSTMNGRNGSNACTFICMYFGQIAAKGLLLPRQGVSLNGHWKDALEEAMIRGNDLHDEIFDHEGINVDIDQAVEMAGDDCGIRCIGQQKDLFGAVAKDLLAELLNEISSRRQQSHHLFFCSDRTMFLMADSCGHLYFVDSHSHRDSGALIASAPPDNGVAFAHWIDQMMNFHWLCPLIVGSVNEVIYS
ncbi:hypothetical protein OS493_020788 [Desmophyllum pertusum]|uniref:Uncharacterized protein n=1 Tax=Desmophyllum pertusum TaxID=174260 RepID=A0A9W9YR26_9CNID|nr:hypothetical protein OS493_020788 [Desmophyllum pertusum]